MSTRLNPNILKGYFVPGLPHLIYSRPEWGQDSWKDLKKAYTMVAQQTQDLEPEVLIIYSSQWISVLGHSYQACPNPVGYHVDENWYDLGDFPFSFPVDLNLTQRAEDLTQKEGFATKLVNYEGFPIDTGTLVTLKYFNPDNKIPVVIVSSNIYCSQEDSYRLGQAMGKAILDSGKRAAIINCSSLSHRFLTQDITPIEDHFEQPQDDGWNQKVLSLLEQGKTHEVMALGPEYAKAANPEMQFKGFFWMMGALGLPKDAPTQPAKVHAYGPLWGTGAAVIEFSNN